MTPTTPPDLTGVVRLIARGRIGLGAAMLLAPRRLLAAGQAGGDVDDTAIAALRMTAGRDLALGLGAELTLRHATPGVRGWVEAGALADAIDAYALGGARRLRPGVRLLGTLVATAAAAAGAVLARRV